MPKNRLISEPSPYLQQHAQNPVHWQPWDEAALLLARTEQKPIFLSIGYSTCYWCHMMEKDSFESPEIAEVLNSHFIPIKVDREERPDLDHVYMSAVTAITGHGGWPLSVFLTPELKPFWGGTFFPRADFLIILERIGSLWQRSPADIEESAKRLFVAFDDDKAEVSDELPDNRVLDWALRSFEETYDSQNGGFGDAPKFLPAMQVSLLLRRSQQGGQEHLLDMARHTLNCMAAGGIYDHLGGGFSRYSTDERWLVPHFEKMLYDNALLLRVYSEAWQLTGESLFEDVVRETVAWLLRDMYAPDGGFYSAQDAGEAGCEGEYYVWRWDEVTGLLGKEAASYLAGIFSLSSEGNFENSTNVLALHKPEFWRDGRKPSTKELLNRMLRQRSDRVRPRLDNKVITAWNGLMISGLACAARVFSEELWLKAAQKSAGIILERLFSGEKLSRILCCDRISGDGCCEDYAFLIEGLLNLYQADFDPTHLLRARELQHIQNRLFWDGKRGGYFISVAADLIRRGRDLHDGALPSANSVAFSNLLLLEKLFPEDGFDTYRQETLRALSINLHRYPQALSRALWCYDADRVYGRELVISCMNCRDEADEALTEIRRRYLPDLSVYLVWPEVAQTAGQIPMLAGKTGVNKTQYSICRYGSCDSPLDRWDNGILTDRQ